MIARLMLGTIAKLFSERPLSDAYRYVVIHGRRVQVRTPHLTFQTDFPQGSEVSTCVASSRLVEALACGAVLTQGDQFLSAKLPTCRVRESLVALDAAGMLDAAPACEGSDIASPRKFLAVLRALWPFVSDDASRAWSCSVLCDGSTAYATNNVMLARCCMDDDFFAARVLVTRGTIDFLLSMPVPTAIHVTPEIITAWWDEGRSWARLPTGSASWPDKDLGSMIVEAGAVAVEPATREALRAALAFLAPNDVVTFREGKVEAVAGDVLANTQDLGPPSSVATWILRKAVIEAGAELLRLPGDSVHGFFRSASVEGAFVGSFI